MGKTVYIAEKPSVATEFAKALKLKTTKKDGYMEGDDSIVTWCVGHLVTMSYPEVYDEKYKKYKKISHINFHSQILLHCILIWGNTPCFCFCISIHNFYAFIILICDLYTFVLPSRTSKPIPITVMYSVESNILVSF